MVHKRKEDDFKDPALQMPKPPKLPSASSAGRGGEATEGEKKLISLAEDRNDILKSLAQEIADAMRFD